MRIGRAAILVSLTLPVWFAAASAADHWSDQEISSQRQLAENVLGASSLFVSVVNVEGSGNPHHAMGWSAVGLGVGVSSIVMSMSRQGETPKFGIVAGSLAVLTGGIRLVRNVPVPYDPEPGGDAAAPSAMWLAVGWRCVGVRASF